MKLDMYQVDAFTDKVFGGNPAAVCPLDEWLDDKTLQNIAAENNLSETAFFVKKGKKYQIRWMTPTVEVDLCGHATLASSYVIFNELKQETDKITFESKSGDLIITKENGLISMNFPVRSPQKTEIDENHLNSVSIKPKEVYFDNTFLFIYNNEKEIREVKPDIEIIKRLKSDGLIITAPGDTVDFVSRFFAPHAGIPEDPVTGYAHTILTPFWAERLGKQKLHARQLSKRAGDVFCEFLGDRVNLAGKTVLYSKGEIYL